MITGLTGCLEQVQSTRIPAGALSNFLMHLQAGELDDARAYFAPGLVTPSAQLDASIKEASDRVRRYEISKKKSDGQDLAGGEREETITGTARLRVPAGALTPGPNEGWQETPIITATIVQRGPGWRILTFELKCCPR
ncbi:MAG: hypothetical protein M3014_04455 [Chloroflexota bacterium]|nr:hypothetical protein [Chloroflexota bacterium]